jgi:hypothetical protein
LTIESPGISKFEAGMGATVDETLPLIALRRGPIIVSDRPSFEHPDSQLPTVGQMLSPYFERWAALLGYPNVDLNRKLWEYVYILRAMDHFVGLRPGTRALGFGVGRERSVSLLASLGCQVVATDYPQDRDVWPDAPRAADDLFDATVCDESSFRTRVSFRDVDMNSIPADLLGFDCLWSCGSLEHIGGLQNGLDYIESAMACLRPGGVAVHTTEFNLVSDTVTLDSPDLSYYRRQDVVRLAERLLANGHQIVLNFTLGDTVADTHIDMEPRRVLPISLKWQVDAHFVITSIGLIIQKRLGTQIPPRRPVPTEIVVQAGSLWISPSHSNIRGSDGIIRFDATDCPEPADALLFYGPYVTLPSGKYRVKLAGEIVGEFSVSFTADNGNILLHTQTVSAASDPVTFISIAPAKQFEVVAQRTGTSQRLTVETIVLTRTD